MATGSVKSLNDLPDEVLLAILSKVKYTPQNLSAVCLTNRLLHDLMTTHRKSLIKDIGQHQFPLESIFIACASPSLIWLEDLSRQKSYLDDVLACARDQCTTGQGVPWFSDEEFDRVARIGLYLEFIVCSTGYPALRHILGNFADDGKDLQFEETKAMAKNHFGLLVEAVIVCNAHSDPGVFDVGLKKAVERRLGRRARGVLLDNLFNADAERIVGELDVAVMDVLKETLSDKAIMQMLAEWQ